MCKDSGKIDEAATRGCSAVCSEISMSYPPSHLCVKAVKDVEMMPIIEHNTTAIHHDTSGIGGTPALFIQRVSVPGCGWVPQMGILQPDYRVIFFDNRGTGKRILGKTPLSVEAMTEDALMLLILCQIKLAGFFSSPRPVASGHPASLAPPSFARTP